MSRDLLLGFLPYLIDDNGTSQLGQHHGTLFVHVVCRYVGRGLDSPQVPTVVAKTEYLTLISLLSFGIDFNGLLCRKVK